MSGEIVCGDLNAAIGDYRRRGFRLDTIFPADNPHTAVLSLGAETVRVTTHPGAALPTGELAEFVPQFVLMRARAEPAEGRAGMFYRDLVPGRLGGRYIVSQITIPTGGPVEDWVHFHDVALQLIFVRAGWVRVVYQDQGEPFVMEAGDLVLQPPGIRHRVLESSPGLEVIEISCPAMHETHADHELALPTGADPARHFGGQRFFRHVAKNGSWTGFGGGGALKIALADATNGLAEARVMRPGAQPVVEFPAHEGELVFGFVIGGTARLEYGEGHDLAGADAFVIPPQEAWSVSAMSDDFRLFHVTTAKMPSSR